MSKLNVVRRRVASYAAYAALAISAAWLMWTVNDTMYLMGWYAAQGVSFDFPYLAFASSLAVLGIGLLLALGGMKLAAIIVAASVMAFVQALWFGTVA